MHSALSRFVARCRSLLGRATRERDMAAEMQAHLEMQAERNVAAGMSAADARHAAQRQFGNVASLQERVRDQRGWRGLENFSQDVRFSLRLLRKQPGFAVAAVLTLALGIGFVTTLFTVLNGIAFRGLPFEASGQIVSVSVPAPQLADYSAAQTGFAELAAVRPAKFNLGGDLATTRQTGARITPNLLGLLRVRPMLGRGLLPEDAAPGAPKVLLIGETVWRQEFRGDPAILRRVVRLDGEPHAIVGVMAAGFAFPRSENLWLPLAAGPDAAGGLVVGRLRPGVSAHRAAEELKLIQSQLAHAADSSAAPAPAVEVVPFSERSIKGAVRNLLTGILVATFLVLVLACANVANLILARACERSRELALRSALGASRGRLIVQMMTESLVLGVLGAALGAAGAYGGTQLLWDCVNREKDLTGGMPFWVSFQMDGTVVGFVALTALLASVLTGLVPALRASRVRVSQQLKDGGNGGTGASRLTRLLVNVQVALSVCLVVAAALFLTLLIDFNRKELAYDPASVLTARAALNETEYPTPAQRTALFDDLLAKLAAGPGVEAVAATTAESFRASFRRIEFEGDAPAPRGREPSALTESVTPGYFETLRQQLRDGRLLQPGDTPAAPAVAVVNVAFAQRFGGERGIVGRRFRLARPGPAGAEAWITVVGVVADAGSLKAGTRTEGPQFYRPLTQEPSANVTLLVRGRGADAPLADWVRRTTAARDPNLPLNQVYPVQRIIEMERIGINVPGVLLVLCGAGALALASVGVYGVISFSVKVRTREFGVRMALGAGRREIMRLVLGGGLRQLALGLGAGVPLALGASAALGSMFAGFGRSAFDVWIYLAVVGLLSAVAAAALWLPARRATKVDPMVALRAE